MRLDPCTADVYRPIFQVRFHGLQKWHGYFSDPLLVDLILQVARFDFTVSNQSGVKPKHEILMCNKKFCNEKK